MTNGVRSDAPLWYTPRRTISNPSLPVTPEHVLPVASSAGQKASERNCGVARSNYWVLDHCEPRNYLLNLFARQRSSHLIKLEKHCRPRLCHEYPKLNCRRTTAASST